MSSQGPLTGLRIIEIAGIGPGPFCGMMLADHGAEVIRIDRPGGVQAGMHADSRRDVMLRSRKTISIDLKNNDGAEIVRTLATTADGLIEGFRPGVMERLGLGPAVLTAANPRLVYGRMTGWGQDGPYARAPGHDINYIALAGALDAIGRAGAKPTPPLNLVGDYGGGGLVLAFGMVSAMLAAKTTGKGRVVDCAMSEGASILMAGIWSMKANGLWDGGRGQNVLDSGAPFYDTYETADGKYIALGSIEAKFYQRLREVLGFTDDAEFDRQFDRAVWPSLAEKLAGRIKTRTRAEWCAKLEAEEVCFAPVLTADEAPHHAHNAARKAFVTIEGVTQPTPAPRYSDTEVRPPVMWRPENGAEALLEELGYDQKQRAALRAKGIIGA
ncbi:MAG: CoA transferase [Rhodospirillaceae bacterium]|nr:CoA transferase [Rhodospirillaceae bacterium]